MSREGTPGRDNSDDPAFCTNCRRDFLSIPLDCLTLRKTIALADRAIQTRQALRHVCINVAKFISMHTNADLDRDVRSSDIISIDGAGIVWPASNGCFRIVQEPLRLGPRYLRTNAMFAGIMAKALALRLFKEMRYGARLNSG